MSDNVNTPVEDERTFTVRELIKALADAENLDATVNIQLPRLKMEPVAITGVDFDPDNDQFILLA